jgi:hypothetical protein
MTMTTVRRKTRPGDPAGGALLLSDQCIIKCHRTLSAIAPDHALGEEAHQNIAGGLCLFDGFLPAPYLGRKNDDRKANTSASGTEIG